jgi:hypothetical protein
LATAESLLKVMQFVKKNADNWLIMQVVKIVMSTVSE